MNPQQSKVESGSLIKSGYKWLDERFKINALVVYMSEKKVPIHSHSAFYYLGGISLFLFLVQVVTGILLLMYYRPGAETAYESVQFIVSQVAFGWLIRSIHAWSANLFILAAFVHMFTVFFTKAYRKPRELTWFTGMGVLGLAMAFGFSGYLLPWNELSFFATKVGTGMAGALPVVGGWLMTVMRGGQDVTGATIGRFFGLHVAILPAAFTLLLGLHLLFVQRQGMSEPVDWSKAPKEKKRFQKFFPNFIMKDALVWLLVLNLLALLAVAFPDGIGVIHWELGSKADPLASAPANIRPEWYFMFAFQALKFLPAHIWVIEGELVGILGFGLGGIIWALVPLLDRRASRDERSPLFTAFGLFVLAFIIVMTIVGYMVK